MAEPPFGAPVLITSKAVRPFDPFAAFQTALRIPGQSALPLARRLFRCTRPPQFLTFPEFFRLGLQRPEVSDAEAAAFFGLISNNLFNRLLNGPDSDCETAALDDKLQTADRLVRAGIPVAGIRAVFPGTLSAGKAEVLTSADEIAAFLTRPDSTPCFGKPVFGTYSRGVVAVEGSVGDGKLVLGDGRVVDAAALAREIVDTYPAGYMFQDLLRASDAVSAISGPVIPIIRIYTLWLEGDARPLYASARLPAPSAMSDDDAMPGSVWMQVDLATGEILRVQDIDKPAGATATHAPVTGTVLKGQRFPDWAQTVAAAVETHRQFPRHRAVGVDLAPSDHGLIVNEANANPGPMIYQMTSLKGLLNPQFRPLFRQALAERGVKARVAGTPWPAD